ncbi:MAG: polyphosphate polymerase domain-containing protein [Planctomycetes bacterium]|nr:polyphosphate polymerase domain-containing protein [Planctomycetota bacterium]
MSSLPPRYELKYWATEDQLAVFFGLLNGLWDRDPHASPECPAYTITSLYLDTPRFDLFHEKVEGLKRRTKVRLRRYNDTRSGFLELKGKRKRRILKSRLALDAESLEAIARGDLGPLSKLSQEGVPAARVLLGEFELRGEMIPSVITRYDREALILKDDVAVRLTVDRRLRAWGQDMVETFLAEGVDQLPLTPMLAREGSPAILEVKSTGPVPPIVASALRQARVSRRSISKYCLSVLRSSSMSDPMKERYRVFFPEAPEPHHV